MGFSLLDLRPAWDLSSLPSFLFCSFGVCVCVCVRVCVWLCFLIFKKIVFIYGHTSTCGILVPQPRIEPTSPTFEAQSLNHWTTREVPCFALLEGGCLSNVCPITVF